MRYIKLETEDLELLELLVKTSTNNTIRKHSQCLLLSHQRRTITDLSTIFDIHRKTVEQWFNSWESDGVNSLSIASGRGVKTRLKGFEAVIKQQVELHNRNIKNILTFLKEEHNIIVCKRTLRNFLKDARLSLKRKRNKDEFELKQEQISDLKQLEDSGYIDLYYGDESHFGLTPNVPYAWQLKDKPLLLPAAKGKFLNVVGLMSRKNHLFSQVLESTFNTDKIIDFMNSFVEQINKKTVVILDNSPIHKSKKFIAKMQEWKKKDVLIFFLPTYSPELNLIEILWRRIKYNWIPLDAYLCFQNLKERLSFVLNNFGTKYDIIF